MSARSGRSQRQRNFVRAHDFRGDVIGLRIAGTSIWPVAVLHGAMNAFVHVNRLGIEIQPSLVAASALALAPVPLCIYSAILLHKQRWITTSRHA